MGGLEAWKAGADEPAQSARCGGRRPGRRCALAPAARRASQTGCTHLTGGTKAAPTMGMLESAWEGSTPSTCEKKGQGVGQGVQRSMAAEVRSSGAAMRPGRGAGASWQAKAKQAEAKEGRRRRPLPWRAAPHLTALSGAPIHSKCTCPLPTARVP